MLSHSAEIATPDLARYRINADIPVFGRWCRFDLTIHRLTFAGETRLAIGYNFRPRSQKFDRRPAKWELAEPDNMMRFRLNEGKSTSRWIEQELIVKPIGGYILDDSSLGEAPVDDARRIASTALRVVEFVAESARQSIRNHLSRGEMRDEILQLLDQHYGQTTLDHWSNLLKSINWAWIVDGVSMADDCRTVLVNTLSVSTPTIRNLFASHVDLRCPETVRIFARYQRAADKNYELRSDADRRAAALLESVCGRALAEEFAKHGQITVQQHGYTFVVRPQSWVLCTDPNGNRSQLCVYTINMCCNPIDELTTAYLYIKHKFREYMRTANHFHVDPGFIREPDLQAA